MSKPTEDEARRALERIGSVALPPAEPERYPRIKSIGEEELFRAHGGIPPPVRIVRDGVGRLRRRVIDQSGLAYGEPVSEGRTDRQKE